MTDITWHQYDGFEKFHVEESRYGIFTSVTESGKKMLSSATYEICVEMTWLYQYCNAPGYDGRYDVSKHSSYVGGKL